MTDLVLVAVRLAGQPATAYYAAHRELAGRLAADKLDHQRDRVRVLPLRDLAIAAALDPADVRRNQLHLLGIQRDDGVWVRPGQGRQHR